MLRTVRVRVFSVLTAGVWPCVSWKEKGFGVSDASQVPEQLGSGSKKLTPKNVLLGLQHVLVSNVWLDPVFVAGAIGLPLALSSNMVNAIFIVSGLVTLDPGHEAGAPAHRSGSFRGVRRADDRRRHRRITCRGRHVHLHQLADFPGAVPDACDREAAVPVRPDRIGRDHLPRRRLPVGISH